MLMAALVMAWGLGVLLGGDMRFSGASFELAETIAPWWFWGSLAVSYGVLLLLSEGHRYHWLVVVLGGGHYAFIVSTYANGAVGSNTVTLAGTFVYSVLWAFHVIVGTRMRMQHATKSGWVAKLVERDREKLERKIPR